MRRTVFAAALAVAAGSALGGSAPARSDVTSCAPRPVLAEPAHTRGSSNTIRWEAIPGTCWDDAGTDRRFVVTVTNTATGAKKTVTVNGRHEVDATVDATDFPGGPAVDGQRFSYAVHGKEHVCDAPGPLGSCITAHTRTLGFANEVTSMQDERAPTGSLVIAGGKTYVRSLEVPVTVNASDPGAASSGAGYVSFGGSGRRGGCGPVTGCAESLSPGLTVQLEPGADGIRTIEARVYDRARGPADDPGTTTIGNPPGNVSTPFRDTVFLDRTAPAIFIRVSTVRIMVGAAVTFDASQSVDVAEGSGLQPVTGEWSFGDGGRTTGLVATHTYSRTGRFPFTFSVADNVGNVARTESDIEVLAVSVPPQPGTTEKLPQAPPPATVDRQTPSFSGLAVRRSGGRATVAFRLSERATVRIEVRRLLPRPVRRTASLSRQFAAGRRGVTLPAASTTKTGRYTIVLVARDRAGNVSKARRLTLTTRARRLGR